MPTVLASSETLGPKRGGSACQFLSVASGCFHLERGHCHSLEVVIHQHWFEATVQVGNNVGYYCITCSSNIDEQNSDL